MNEKRRRRNEDLFPTFTTSELRLIWFAKWIFIHSAIRATLSRRRSLPSRRVSRFLFSRRDTSFSSSGKSAPLEMRNFMIVTSPRVLVFELKEIGEAISAEIETKTVMAEKNRSNCCSMISTRVISNFEFFQINLFTLFAEQSAQFG